jgi:pimeloyl-ACP methyl ester carboxylesterase
MPSVLLIHGLGGSAAIWGPVRAGLADGVDTVAPDLEGGRPIEQEAVQALEAIGDRQAVIAVGHSMGGLVATALAELAPERVAALVLINTPPTLESRLTASRGSERLVRRRVIGRVAWALASERRRRAGLQTAVAPRTPVPDELVQALNGTSHHAFTGSTAAVDAYLAEASLRDRLSELTAPVTVIFGTEDQRVALGSLAEYEGLGHVNVQRVPDVGHTPPLERPAAVAQALRRVLADVSGT